MKKFFGIIAFIAVILTSCDNGTEAPATTSPTIVPSKSVVEFGKNGGEQSIKFTIKSPKGGELTVEESTEWLETSVNLFTNEILISVEANNGEAREANFALKYPEAKDVVVTVKQTAGNSGEYDVIYEVNRFEGIYFGTEYSTNYNYYIILSDIGANLDGSPKANGTYYFFDIYSKVAGDSDAPVLPNGTYKFDAENTFGDLTFSDDGSWYAEMDDKGAYKRSANIIDATITVTDGKFEAIVEFTNGEVHKIIYEGDLTVDFDYITSTFTEDFTFAIEGATITATNYGDTLENGLQNWYIEAVKGNDLFMLEIFTTSTESPAGIYSHFSGSTGESYEKKFIPGLIGEGLIGSWYAKLTGGTIKGDVMAPIFEGIVQVVVDDDTAKLNYSAKDDAGNKVEGSVSGSYAVGTAE